MTLHLLSTFVPTFPEATGAVPGAPLGMWVWAFLLSAKKLLENVLLFLIPTQPATADTRDWEMAETLEKGVIFQGRLNRAPHLSSKNTGGGASG